MLLNFKDRSFIELLYSYGVRYQADLHGLNRRSSIVKVERIKEEKQEKRRRIRGAIMKYKQKVCLLALLT